MTDYVDMLFQALKPASPDEQIANMRKIRALAEEAAIETCNQDYVAKFMSDGSNYD